MSESKHTAPDMLRSALQLLKEGFYVIPVKEKQSLIGWKKYQNTKPTEEEVRSWWTRWPNADIATVLRPDEVVLDVDNPHFSGQLIEKGVCNITRVEQSPRGTHIWFKEINGSIHKNEPLRNQYGMDADIKGYGGYLVIPPSNNYILLSDKPILEVSNARKRIFELLGIDESKACGESEVHDTDNHDAIILEGSRNNTLTKMAGSLFNKSHDYEAGLKVLKAFNQTACNPPLAEDEVEHIAKSIHAAEINSSPIKKKMPIKWISLKELSETVMPDVSWLWEGFLGKGYVTLFSGRPKMGKTTFLFELIKSFLGKKPLIGYKTNLDGKVLILTEENKQLYRKRVEEAGLSSSDVFILTRFDVLGYSLDELLTDLKQAIKEHGFSLIVVDTLSDFWGVKEENSSSEIQNAMRGLRAIAVNNHVSVLAIHHLRKMDGEDGTAVRGSGSLMGSVDIGLEFRKNNGKTQNRRVICSNSRFPETPKEIIIELGKEGYKLLGNAVQVTKDDIMARFLEALPETEYESLEVIRKKLNPEPGAALLKKIAGECRKQKRLDFAGEGVKGKPYQYRKIQVEALV